MGDLKPIVDKIIEDANVKASEIKDNADSKISKLYADFENEKKVVADEKNKKDELEIAKIREINAAKNVQLLKSELLKVKLDSIKDVVEKAKEQILHLGNDEYSDFLRKIYEKVKQDKEGIIYLNEQDQKRVKGDTFDGAQISKDSIKIKGGFVLNYGKIEYDCTLDSLFEEKLNDICDNVNALYKEEVK